MNRLFLWAFALLFLRLSAQSTATLAGEVLDPAGSAVPGAVVRLSNAIAGYSNQVTTGDDGHFQFINVPFQTYALRVEKPGFAPGQQSVSLRSNVPFKLDVTLAISGQGTAIDVTATELRATIDTEATGTRTELDAASFSRLPSQASGRGIESVLLSFPGFAADANGAIHPRGAHNQMTYVIDGMPISDQLTGAFSNAVDPTIVQTIELFTGDVPAEYGSKVSGVANITTRTGMGSGRKAAGSTQLYAAGFDTYSHVSQVQGGTAKFGYFASVNTLKSNRYLDSVSLSNLHNGGNSERGFTRFDYQPTARDTFRLNLIAGRSNFQLANLRSQHANLQDQRQQMRDLSVSTAWVRTIDARSTLDATASYRTAIAELFSSPGDTPVTASQARHLSTFNLSVRYNRVSGIHNLRMGADLQRTPISEFFSFGITNPDFNDPAQDGYLPNLHPYDLSRGGRPFVFAGKLTGALHAGFLQDRVKWRRLTLSLGLRYDHYNFVTKGVQLQPRAGVAFHLKETGTVFRASYNRNYQTPPNENLLLSSSREAGKLAPDAVREAFGGGVVIMRPERQDFLEAGLQQTITRHIGFSGSFYHKHATDLQDNDNFLNTGIIFPITLAKSRINGVEGRFNFLPVAGFSGSLNFTHYHAIVTPPFTGGLFLGSGAVDSLSAGPFVIDHDQKLGIHGMLNYAYKRNWWANLSVRYDSGLVSNPSDPKEVAVDPDYHDLLPYVNLESFPARVRPRTVTDISVGHDHYRGDRKTWDISFQLTNLANTVAMYNFQSIFVGTRIVQPRTAGVKLRYFW
ncbi:MAG: TonB-dependent receptor [Acidobacteria bacterium]|nr:TonB-dependent receptor [Acidobacteriota bacterium]